MTQSLELQVSIELARGVAHNRISLLLRNYPVSVPQIAATVLAARKLSQLGEAHLNHTSPAFVNAIADEVQDADINRAMMLSLYKKSKPGEALGRYETGLELYPTWPQGRFNAALIAAELGYFADAVEHMQAYLEFVPDAPDVQAARDQMAMWQFKVKETE